MAKRTFTKYPSNITASTDIDYKKLKDKIRVAVWNDVCDYIEGLSFDEIANVNLKKFYANDSDSRISQILRDLDNLSEHVASYIVDTEIESEETA